MQTTCRAVLGELRAAAPLPGDPALWQYQLKLDGYRTIAFKTSGKIHLQSRSDNDCALGYPAVSDGLDTLPDETVIDGEVVAFHADGRPSFRGLHNMGWTLGPGPVLRL